MAKKSEKNESRRLSLRKVKESPKKANKAREAQQKTNKATYPKKKKTNEAWSDLERKVVAELKAAYKFDSENFEKRRMVENERNISKILDIGYVFRPAEGKLLDYYLRNKIMDEPMDDYCPIKEVSVYENHPEALAGKSKVWYFFTHSGPNEIQPGPDFRGHWIRGEKKDIIYQDKKIGGKQLVEYCEGGHKSEYKIIEYQLDPAPDYMKNGLWFICKLYKDVCTVDLNAL